MVSWPLRLLVQPTTAVKLLGHYLRGLFHHRYFQLLPIITCLMRRLLSRKDS